MRIHRWRSTALTASLSICTLVGTFVGTFVGTLVGVASAQQGDHPIAVSGTTGICPAIENYELCDGDAMTGNCTAFVAGAAALAGNFASQLAEHPDSRNELETTNWWGCGSADLPAIRAMLAEIDTPRARELLQNPPYRDLANAPGAPSGEANPPQPIDCTTLPEPEQDTCATRQLAAAEAAQTQAFERCKEILAPDLRSNLIASHKAWNSTRAIECDTGEGEYHDPALEAYARKLCMAKSAQQRTMSIRDTYPECRGSN